MHGPEASVLIVGAGPTGLTAACELCRHGLRPEIIDRSAGPTPLSKAVGISPRSLEILEPCGATERLLARGIRIRRLSIHGPNGENLGAIDFTAISHRFDFLLALPQSETEETLIDVLRHWHCSVRWHTAFTGGRFQSQRSLAYLELEGGVEHVEADYLLGADGVHSAVREAAGVAFPGYEHARRWSIADVEVAGWPYEPESAHLFLGHGGDVGFIIPIGARRMRAVSNTPDAMSRIPGSYQILAGLRKEDFLIPVRLADSFQQGRTYLAGDAVHVHSPVGARGMNLGIEDAADFAARLRDDSLTGYTAARRPAARDWIALSERILAAAQAQGTARIALRNGVLKLLTSFPTLQRPIVRRVAGLSE